MASPMLAHPLTETRRPAPTHTVASVRSAAWMPARIPGTVLPNCTAADLAQVSAGVAAATSAYLFPPPDVNAYFTSLKGQPRSDIRDQVKQYMDANPQTHADLEGIRQPLTDFQNRCQYTPAG